MESLRSFGVDQPASRIKVLKVRCPAAGERCSAVSPNEVPGVACPPQPPGGWGNRGPRSLAPTPRGVLQGWFNETLPRAAIERIAFLRLDGDM